MSKSSHEFRVTGRVEVEVDVVVRAKSLEEALTKSKELKVHDFISFEGEYMDGDVEIKGLWRS